MTKPTAGYSLRKTARILGIDAGQLTKEAQRHDFPVTRVKGRRKFYDPEDVRRWRGINVRSRRPQDQTPQAPKPSTDPDVQALRNPESTGAQMARAAASLAAGRLADSAEAGTIGAVALNDLKLALDSLRKAEAAALAQDVKARNLYPADEIKMVIGQMVARSLMVIAKIGAGIAVEVEIWVSDPTFLALGSDERKRRVMSWYDTKTRELENQEAESVRQLVSGNIDGDAK